MTGLGYQIHARRYATGVSNTGVNLSLLNVEGDTATVTGLSFLNILTVQSTFGGSSVQGGRQGVQVGINQTAPTANANANRNYVGGYFAATSSSGDGGRGLLSGNGGGPINAGQAAGGYFGINPVCILKPGAVNTLNCSGGEVNVAVQAGASAFYKSGLQISKLGSDAVQGSSVDAAISLSDQGGAKPWRDGILFGTQNGQFPIAGDGYLLRSYGPGVANVAITALGIIQTSNLAGSGNRLIFADPSGALTLTPTAVPTSSSSACSVGQQAADASYAYFCVAANTWRRAALTAF
jgi:hypothetical protein